MESLFDRMGGKTAIDAAVELFYFKVLADRRVRHLFEGMDVEVLKDHQRQFLTYAFGGSAAYRGKDLRSAHLGLVKDRGLSDLHFDAIIQALGSTLEDLNVPQQLIAEALAIAESTRDEVLAR